MRVCLTMQMRSILGAVVEDLVHDFRYDEALRLVRSVRIINFLAFLAN